VGALPPTGSIKSIMTTDAAMLSVKKSSNMIILLGNSISQVLNLYFNDYEFEFF
jgi:hypothetical protein